MEFSEEEIKKVQDDIDSVNRGAKVDTLKLAGFPCDINELCDLLNNCYQLLNGIKPDAVNEKWWTEWDESVLQSILTMQRQIQPFYQRGDTI